MFHFYGVPSARQDKVLSESPPFYLSRPRLMQIRLYLSPLLHFRYKVTLAETEKSIDFNVTTEVA